MKTYEDFLSKYAVEDNPRTAFLFKNREKNFFNITRINRRIEKNKKIKKFILVPLVVLSITLLLLWETKDSFSNSGIFGRYFLGTFIVTWSIFLLLDTRNDNLKKELDLETQSFYSRSKYTSERLLCSQIISYLESEGEKSK